MARYAVKTPTHHTTWDQMLEVGQPADEIDVYESAWNGRFQLSKARNEPKPIQQPRPPIVIGGGARSERFDWWHGSHRCRTLSSSRRKRTSGSGCVTCCGVIARRLDGTQERFPVRVISQSPLSRTLPRSQPVRRQCSMRGSTS